MVRYNDMVDCHIALATGDDAGAGAGLTAWRNADAAYVAGELIPCDTPLGWNFKPLHYTTVTDGSASASRVSDRYSTTRNAGTWTSKHAFQTCQFIWWLMQTAGTPTTEGTPAGYNTHTLTIGATNTPKWHGIHFEREGIVSSELRYDMMGLVPSDLVISCSQRKGETEAIQEITIPFANKVAGGNIAAQTPRPWGTTGSILKTWDHCITGNGGGLAANVTGLLYNGAGLGCDVKGHRLIFHRDVELSVPDVNGIHTIGQMHGWKYSVELDVMPTTGSSVLYALNGLKKESYAGDLDYAFAYIADATNDRIDFTYDKMYMLEFDENNDFSKRLEAYTITLEPLDTTSSLTVVGIDGLDNTHFENP
jgi:hypothetical protein